MGFFDETVAAHLQDKQLGAALLCFMDFADYPARWWTGAGILNAGGYDWTGTGEFISIEGLEQPLGTSAPKTTFTLSGIDSNIVQLVRQASTRVKDRRCTVYIQWFEISPEDASEQPWRTLDNPYAIWTGFMDQMSYKADGPKERSITLTAESLWTNRKKPPYGMYTDRDQNARYPGDRGLEQVVNLVNKTTRWPVL